MTKAEALITAINDMNYHIEKLTQADHSMAARMTAEYDRRSLVAALCELPTTPMPIGDPLEISDDETKGIRRRASADT